MDKFPSDFYKIRRGERVPDP